MPELKFVPLRISERMIAERRKRIEEGKYNMPASVPILSGKDFCIAELAQGNGQITCCMIGWAANVFGRLPFDHLVDTSDVCRAIPDKVLTTMVQQAFPETPIEIDDYHRTDPTQAANLIPDINDRMSHSKAKTLAGRVTVHKNRLARWWNRTMAALGYTEGNPEAGKVKAV